jgi:hypothetical protein
MIEFFGIRPSLETTEEALRGAASMGFENGNGCD